MKNIDLNNKGATLCDIPFCEQYLKYSTGKNISVEKNAFMKSKLIGNS